MAEQGKRKRISSLERQQQILDVAERLFGEDGYERVSMERIAADAGVTRTLVYQHYASKKDLYLAVLDRAIPDFIKRVVPPIRTRPKHPWRILVGLRAFLTLLQERSCGVALLLSPRPQEPWIAERLDQLVEDFTDYFVAEYAGIEPESKIRLLARCYLSILENIAHVWPVGMSSDLSLDDAVEIVAGFLWGGLSSLELPDEMVDKANLGKPPSEWDPDIDFLRALAVKYPGSAFGDGPWRE